MIASKYASGDRQSFDSLSLIHLPIKGSSMSQSRRFRRNFVNKVGLHPTFERLEARELMTVTPQWFETVTPASAASNGQRDYVVSLHSNFASSPKDAQQKLAAGGVQVLEGLGLDSSLHIRFGGTQTALRSMPGIRSVFPDSSVRATDVDPMTNTAWNYSRIGAQNAWQYGGATGEGTIVAVVDTGIDFAHPDLQPRLARNWAEVGENGVDDDQNGFVDDTYGYDFFNNDYIAADDNRHGTHVSGTIVGASNGLGTQGIAYNAEVMPLKALGANGFGTISSVVRSINYATLQKQRGANVVSINLSLATTSENPTLRQALESATAAGIVVVTAAGNNEANLNIQPVFPAAFNMPGLITVAATASNDTRARFSNFGTGVDIAAPGNQILSTVPGGGFTYLSGTSMAAPHVAGAIALLRSIVPNAPVDTVIDALYRGAEQVANLSVDGNRRLNLANSVEILTTALPQTAFGTQPWNAGTSYRGFMIEPSDFYDPNNRAPKLQELASWNVNLVRWQMLMYGDNGKSIAQQFAEATSFLLASLPDFRRAGISVIVDFHPRNNLGENIGVSLQLQTQLVAAWRQLATVLRNDSTVVAYDVFNEPPMAVGTWNALLKQLVAGIRQVDRSTPILIAPARTDLANMTKLPRFAPEQNVVYTMHMYDPMGYTHQGLRRDDTRNWAVNTKYDQVRRDRTMAALERVRNWQNTFPEASRPRIYVGEFSVVREFQDINDSDGDGNVTERLPVHGTTDYLRDCITKFEQYGWDWSYHAYDEATEWDLRLGNPQDLELLKSEFQKNATTLRDGMKVSLQTFAAWFLCAEGGGGNEINATRRVAAPWETFEIVVLSPDKLALRGANGQFVSAENGGGGRVLINRDVASWWETFTIYRVSKNKIGLQAFNGAFVSAELGGGGEVVANRAALGGWETFQFSVRM